jgi:hypothetical protein
MVDMMTLPGDPIRLFCDYLILTGVGQLDSKLDGDPALAGKRLGLINGASWIALWCNYFGRLELPGVQLVNAGNDAIQLNFTRAFVDGEPCLPQSSIDAFTRFA